MPAPRKSTRRDFLRGQSAIDALQEAADRLSPDAAIELPASTKAGYLLHFGRRAMACEFEVLLNVGQYAKGGEAAVAALDLVDELEAQLTVYRDDSEVGRLNARAHDEPVVVEARLFELLEQAYEIHRATGGAHDITSGPLSKLWGFHRRVGRVPTDAELAETMERVGLRHVVLDGQRQSVHFDIPGVEINLGSIGKGYALDRAASVMAEAGIGDFLLHGGNSSVLARGNQTGSRGWWVGLRHPLRPERRLGEVCLVDRALGTSGSGTQFFLHQGRRYGHILDPRSGRPAEGTLSTTVLAPTAADADAMATALFVMGPEAATRFCEGRPDLGVIIFAPGRSAASVEAIVCNVAEDDLRLSADESVAIRHA